MRCNAKRGVESKGVCMGHTKALDNVPPSLTVVFLILTDSQVPPVRSPNERRDVVDNEMLLIAFNVAARPLSNKCNCIVFRHILMR